MLIYITFKHMKYMYWQIYSETKSDGQTSILNVMVRLLGLCCPFFNSITSGATSAFNLRNWFYLGYGAQ